MKRKLQALPITALLSLFNSKGYTMKNNITETDKLFNQLADGLAEGAINEAFAYIQKQLGTTCGGFAGMFLDGDREQILLNMFNQYIRAQISFDIDHDGGDE